MEVTSRDADIASVFDRGLQAHNAGDLSAAEQLYQEALSIQPDHCEANHNIGVLLAEKNELDKALKFFKYALDSSPNVSLFWASYIDALIKLERITESKNLIKAVKGAGISCDKIDAISQRLEIEHQEPGPKGSQELNELIEHQKFDEAIQACLNLMDTYPTSAVLNINLGQCYFGLGQIEKAIEYLNKAVELQPNDPELYATLGVELINNGKYEQAIEYLKKALNLDPNSSSVLSMIGDAYNATNHHELAIGYYKKALLVDPDDEKLYFNIGNALQADRSLDRAIKSYNQAIHLKPDYVEALVNLGVAQKNKDEFDASIKTFEQALKIDPDCADAYYNMGNTLNDKNDHEAALDSFQKAINIEPSYADAYIGMGHAHFNLGNYENAKNCFDSTGSQYAIAKSIECLFFQKEYEEFDNVLKTLTKTDPKNIRVAAISTFSAQQREQKNIYPFCKDPMKLINFSNLKSHVSEPKKFINNILDEMDKKDTTWQPKNRSTKAGFQTNTNIFDRSNATITLLEDIILKELDLFFKKFKSHDNVIFNNWPEKKKLDGWFVRLVQNGHLSSHIHPTGWVSGVLYLKTVQSPSEGEGAIEFSIQGYDYPIIRDDYPRRLHQPMDGEIVLFPSSLFHRTIPVIKDVERSVIAFDLNPG